MNLKWIAAVLFPANVAPHPNLLRTEAIDQPSLFALVPMLRVDEFDQLTGEWPIPTDRDAIEPHPVTREFARLVRTDVDSTSLEALTNTIMGTDWQGSDQLAAFSLMLSALLAEADDDRTAVRVLDHALDNLSLDSSDEAAFVQACVYQQRARRLWDLGESNGRESAQEAFSILESLSIADLDGFDQSRATPHNSIDTLSVIRDSVLDAAMSHLQRFDEEAPDEQRWVSRLQRRSPYLTLRAEARASGGYSAWFDAEFDRRISGVSSTRRDQGQSSLGAALLHYELVGAPEVVEARRELASFYFVLSQSESEISTVLLASAVRLLRRGEDRKSLNELVRHLRTSGPMEALRTDCSRLLLTRSSPNRLRIFEHATLSCGGEYLTAEEAQKAFPRVLETTEQTRVHTGGTWQAEHLRLEEIWNAAIALSGPAGYSEDLGRRLLDHLSGNILDEQVFDHVYARLLDELPWISFSEDLMASWSTWLETASDRGFSVSADVAYPHIRSEYARPAPENDDITTIGDVIAHLNQQIRYETPYPRTLLDKSVQLVSEEMRTIREDARNGRYSAGNSACSVAVGLAMYTTADSLWKDITAFLKDGSVSRQDKLGALERIAFQPGAVPRHAIYALSIEPELLLHSMRDVFTITIDPFPAALRCLSAVHAISDDEAMTRTTELSAASAALNRVEAGRTLTTLARRADGPTWVFPLAFTLSYDGEAGVRAEAARCLMYFLVQPGPLQAAAMTRTLELISEPSTLVPTLILRGLQEQEPEVRDRATPLVDAALSHPSFIVRSLASQLGQRIAK